MKIGNVQLKNDLILAPMANYTDAGMRYLRDRRGAYGNGNGVGKGALLQ